MQKNRSSDRSIRRIGILLCFLPVFLLSYHLAQAQESVSPHGKLMQGLDCSSCHRSDAWKPVKKDMDFNHAKMTGFPLMGVHKVISCQSCHINLRFDEPKATANTCSSCHVDVHQGKLGEDCQSCHNETSFKLVSGVAAHMKTNFPLTGAHAVISCESCHKTRRNGAFTPLSTSCYSCHEQDYLNAKSVNHVANNFSTDCQNCHSTAGWGSSKFDHVTASGGFALLGAHKDLRCVSCHETTSLKSKFPATSDQDCYSCHTADYQRAHNNSGFPHTCTDCHNVNTWGNVNFDHAAVANGFALLGAHKTLQCSSCHDLPSYKPKFTATSDQDCYNCHTADYQRAHGSSGFPHTCTDCHNVNTWSDANFDHAAVANGFALLGAHKTLQCSSCHEIPSYKPKFTATSDQDCYNCHVTDYQNAHNNSGFSHTCTNCHNVNTWDNPTFDHASASNGFALLGAHKSLQCSSCHNIPSFTAKFTATSDQDCYSCHSADYQQAHSGTGFSHTCTDCHNVNTWDGATFKNHDSQFFPIYSGTHANTWTSCQTCHTDPSNYKTFTCLSCHEHNKTTTDSHHTDVQGYSYVSTACYSCHPTGRGGD